MPNVVDGIIVAIIAGAVFWGWKSGLLRQLVALSGTLAAFIVAKQLYEPIGTIFSDFAFVQTLTFYQALSYLLVMLFTAALWFVAIRRIYPYTHLTDTDGARGVRGVDNVGGMFLGLLVGILLAIAFIGVTELLVYSRWPVFEAAGTRTAIHRAMQDSILVRGLFTDVPALMQHVEHWVPGISIARDGRIQT